RRRSARTPRPGSTGFSSGRTVTSVGRAGPVTHPRWTGGSPGCTGKPRSVRDEPGRLPPAAAVDVLPVGAEERANVRHEQVGNLECGEVAAAVEHRPVRD